MKANISYGWPELRIHPVHRHSTWSIIMYLKGTGHTYTEFGEYPFAPGQAVVLPPGTEHSSRSEEDFHSISVTGDFSHLLMGDRPLVLWDNEQGDGAYLVQLLYRNRYADSPFVSELVSAYVHFWSERACMTGEKEAAVERVCQKITEQALNKHIDVGDILRSSGYAEDYMRMLFRKKYGVPPLKFLAKIRIEHAGFLLDTYSDTVPLADIAEKSGYDDYIYFSKTFKAYTGMSPREYIKAARKS